MARKEFNDHMDNYIVGIRQKSKSAGVRTKKKKQQEESVPSDVDPSSVYVIKKPKNVFQRVFEAITKEDTEDFEERVRVEKKETVNSEQAFEQEYDEIKHEQDDTFWKRVRSLFGRKVEPEYQDVHDQEEIDQERIQQEIEKAQRIKRNQETEEALQRENDRLIQEAENEPKKEGMFTKILDFFGITIEDSTHRHDDEHHADHGHTEYSRHDEPSSQHLLDQTQYEELIKGMKKDMKQIAKISLEVMKKMTKKELQVFKTSKEFEQFKSILERNSLLKKETQQTNKYIEEHTLRKRR